MFWGEGGPSDPYHREPPLAQLRLPRAIEHRNHPSWAVQVLWYGSATGRYAL